MADFSHLNEHCEGTMVDVSPKASTQRRATAEGYVMISSACHSALTAEAIKEIITTARIAGISAAKRTDELIPYCHQIPLSYVGLSIILQDDGFHLTSETKTQSNTGVEMEALVALSIAAATIYDMIKAKNPEAVLGPFRLKEKSGGKSHYRSSEH